MRRILTFSILLALSFSVLHEFVIVEYDENHCSIHEFVHEVNAPSHTGDICDIHFEFHQVYLAPQHHFALNQTAKMSNIIADNECYNSFIPQKTIIPPIV